jgi:hypothetical protein
VCQKGSELFKLLTPQYYFFLKKVTPQYLLVSIPESTELLLPCSVPAVEADLAAVGVKVQGVNLNTNGGCNRHNKIIGSSITADGTSCGIHDSRI